MFSLFFRYPCKYGKKFAKSSTGSIHSLHYLHQDAEKTYSEILKMRSYWKYSIVTICRYMKNNMGDLVIELRKNNQGRLPKLSA